MAQDETLMLVNTLRASTSIQETQGALHRIKSYVVGHTHRKEAAIKAGIAQVLVNILDDVQRSATGEEAVLIIVRILGILATAGSQVAIPLLAAKVDRHVIQLLISHSWAAIRHACIRTLLELSYASAHLSGSGSPLELDIITTDTASTLLALMRDAVPTRDGQLELDRLLTIITLATTTPEHKAIMLSSGILDVLANTFASFAASTLSLGHLIDADLRVLPDVICLVQAIGTIIQGSCYRTQYFVHHSSLRKLCSELGEHQLSKLPDVFAPRLILPKSTGFATYKPDGPRHSDADSSHFNILTSLMLLIARNSTLDPTGHTRLAILSLLSRIEASNLKAALLVPHIDDPYKARYRERQLALLGVPLCTTLLESSLVGSDRYHLGQLECIVHDETCCSVLAALIEGRRELQSAAVNANAIKMACATLKDSFVKIPLTKPLWTPHSKSQQDSVTLGDAGLPLQVLHMMSRRLGALLAVAALASDDEEHRKEIISAGAVPYLIEALKPMSGVGTTRQLEGNTTAVILAACMAIKNISRSVANLRTSLIDGGVVTPVFELLNHPDMDVQLAATDVCVNFVLDISPMRDDLVNLGIIKILAENAKRGNAKMRLSSLWAIKHLFLRSDSELRNNVINELGLEFLMTTAQGQPVEEHVANKGSVALNSANAAGEQVDLLNPLNMDIDSPYDHNSVDDEEYIDEDGDWKYDDASKTSYHDSSLRSTFNPPLDVQKYLATLKQAEDNAAYRANREDIDIQEQALDTIRNLLHGEDGAGMLNRIFTEIGPTRLWDLLLPKLLPIPGRCRTGRNGESRPVYHPTAIVASAIHVMNHIANGNSAHKEMLTNAKPLLKALLPHFEKTAHAKVRLIAVLFVISLMYVDDAGDQNAARRRAHELRVLGIEGAVRNLSSDVELDIRERVKSAVRQFDSL